MSDLFAGYSVVAEQGYANDAHRCQLSAVMSLAGDLSQFHPLNVPVCAQRLAANSRSQLPTLSMSWSDLYRAYCPARVMAFWCGWLVWARWSPHVHSDSDAVRLAQDFVRLNRIVVSAGYSSSRHWLAWTPIHYMASRFAVYAEDTDEALVNLDGLLESGRMHSGDALWLYTALTKPDGLPDCDGPIGPVHEIEEAELLSRDIGRWTNSAGESHNIQNIIELRDGPWRSDDLEFARETVHIPRDWVDRFSDPSVLPQETGLDLGLVAPRFEWRIESVEYEEAILVAGSHDPSPRYHSRQPLVTLKVVDSPRIRPDVEPTSHTSATPVHSKCIGST